MSVEVEPPYRGSCRGRRVYHTDPNCPSGQRIPNPLPYTGNEFGYELCEYCEGIRSGKIDAATCEEILDRTLDESISAIARDLGVDRGTVRYHLEGSCSH